MSASPPVLELDDLNALRHCQAEVGFAQASLGTLLAQLGRKYSVGPGEYIQMDGIIVRRQAPAGEEMHAEG